MDFRTVPVPFHDCLGLRVVTNGSPSRLELDLGEHVRGALAPIHGGVLATLIDVACGCAAASADFDPTTTSPVSTDLTVRFLRQPKGGPLVAVAEVVNVARTSLLVECVVTDAAGRQVARGGGSFQLVSGFHSHAAGSR